MRCVISHLVNPKDLTITPTYYEKRQFKVSLVQLKTHDRDYNFENWERMLETLVKLNKSRKKVTKNELRHLGIMACKMLDNKMILGISSIEFQICGDKILSKL